MAVVPLGRGFQARKASSSRRMVRSLQEVGRQSAEASLERIGQGVRRGAQRPWRSTTSTRSRFSHVI